MIAIRFCLILLLACIFNLGCQQEVSIFSDSQIINFTSKIPNDWSWINKNKKYFQTPHGIVAYSICFSPLQPVIQKYFISHQKKILSESGFIKHETDKSIQIGHWKGNKWQFKKQKNIYSVYYLLYDNYGLIVSIWPNDSNRLENETIAFIHQIDISSPLIKDISKNKEVIEFQYDNYEGEVELPSESEVIFKQDNFQVLLEHGLMTVTILHDENSSAALDSKYIELGKTISAKMNLNLQKSQLKLGEWDFKQYGENNDTNKKAEPTEVLFWGNNKNAIIACTYIAIRNLRVTKDIEQIKTILSSLHINKKTAESN